jgi:diguanylate cyclase (GGDEF)-like protein
MIAIAISIVILLYSLLLSKRMAALSPETKLSKNRLALNGSIVFLILTNTVYAYVLRVSSGISAERTVSSTILLAGSTLILMAVILIYSISVEKQRLKEMMDVYQKQIEETIEDHNSHEDRHEASPLNPENTESLTGLHNKQYLQDKLGEEITRAKRQRIPLYLAMFDIDNDKLPKNVLNIVGNVIANNIRDKIDTGFHYEGKKFAIVLPFTIKDHAVTIAKRVLLGLNSWEITASMGLISCSEIGINDANELIKIAELAISEAKAEGGNRIRLLEKSSSDRTDFAVPVRNKIKHLKLLK